MPTGERHRRKMMEEHALLGEPTPMTPLHLVTEEEVDRRVKVATQSAIKRFVLPAFLIAGLGIVGSLWWGWKVNHDRIHDDCIAAVITRNNFRTFAFGSTGQWKQALSIFPQDSPQVGQLMAINQAREAKVNHDFPETYTKDCP
jgi:hypothetical protein